MYSQKDMEHIYGTAEAIIINHGESAEQWALDKMQGYMDADDAVTASVWQMVAQAIQEIKQSAPSGKTSVIAGD